LDECRATREDAIDRSSGSCSSGPSGKKRQFQSLHGAIENFHVEEFGVGPHFDPEADF
jgi:hypothetical protein